MKSSMMIILIPVLILSPFIAMSMNSWFTMWLILELNLMSFIPFMIFFNQYFKESSMKYFIIQSSSSSIFIFFSILNSMNNFNIQFNKLSLFIILMMNLSILMKLGASPFHNWFINLMNNLNWMNCLLLSTWQKIIPLVLLSLNYNKFIILLSSLLSSLISSMMGNNHQSIRIIMGYSSINNLSWMMMSLMFSNKLLILFFNLYLLMNISLLLMFNYFEFYYINQIILLKISNIKFMFLMNFFSMANLPPFLGFMMKWASICILSMKINNILLVILILMSLFSFIFYSRIIMSMMLLYKHNNKMYIEKFYNFKNYMLLKFMIFGMPLNLWMMNSWIL